MNTRELGNIGESIAAELLKKEKMKILERNFRFYKQAEIDIIAKDKDTYVFIEVKMRKSPRYGYGREAVTKAKQYNIRRCAEYYLLKNKLTDVPCRFDVIDIMLNDGEISGELIKNAF